MRPRRQGQSDRHRCLAAGAGPRADAAVTAAGPAGRPALAVASSGLTKRFRGGQVAVDHIDLAVPRGCVYGFLGPNGSGKTTTIRMLLGLAFPTSGSAELLGVPMPAGAVRVLPRVGSLIEGPGFYPFLTGQDNLARCDAADRTADPRTAAARIGEALDRVGLLVGGPQAVPPLLTRHEAAARHRRQPADPAGADRAGRADQRARPAGHPRGPRAHPQDRRRAGSPCSSPRTCSPRSSRSARTSA